MKIDKRTKAYKDSLKQSEDMKDVPSIGLGDSIEKVLKATGIKKAVEMFMDGKDCGCDKRRDLLNKVFSYKTSCLNEYEYTYLTEYNKRHNPKSFKGDDVRVLLNVHQRVFKVRPRVCANCNSGVKIMNDVVDNLNKLLKLYEE